MIAQSERRGVLVVTDLPRLFPEITFEHTDTMGHLHDTGVFEALRTRLLLPESYTICGIYLDRNNLRDWLILIESPDLPDADTASWNDIEYPHIEPTYCQTWNKDTGQYEPHLVSIAVKSQHTIPVTGGAEWLLRATVGNLAEERKP